MSSYRSQAATREPSPDAALNILRGMMEALGLMTTAPAADFGDALEAGTFGDAIKAQGSHLYYRKMGAMVAALMQQAARTGTTVTVGSLEWALIDHRFPFALVGAYQPAKGINNVPEDTGGIAAFFASLVGGAVGFGIGGPAGAVAGAGIGAAAVNTGQQGAAPVPGMPAPTAPPSQGSGGGWGDTILTGLEAVGDAVGFENDLNGDGI